MEIGAMVDEYMTLRSKLSESNRATQQLRQRSSRACQTPAESIPGHRYQHHPNIDTQVLPL